MNYVLGFMFSPDLDQVVLIEKNKPDWQKGKLNGVGGKVEDGEPWAEAMAREFKEETGLNTWPENWIHVATIKEHKEQGVCVAVFTCFSGSYSEVASKTDESIIILDPFYIPRRLTIPNLKWIVPMCQWVLRKEDPHYPLDIFGGLQ